VLAPGQGQTLGATAYGFSCASMTPNGSLERDALAADPDGNLVEFEPGTWTGNVRFAMPNETMQSFYQEC
jgi:hypothetical protein